jgi:hypothetical protein
MMDWHPLAVMQVLLLVTVANGAPVLAKKLLGGHFAQPLDCGVTLWDGRPLLGHSKTVRGVFLAVLFCAIAGLVVGPSAATGVLVGLAAMAGDLLSSFIKRRMGLDSSSMAPGLDQLPESLLPFLVVAGPLGLGPVDIVSGVTTFWAGEIILSRILFALRIRDRPY